MIDPFGLCAEWVSENSDTILNVLHVGLDIAGMIPAFGMVPDAINLLIYLAEHDYGNAIAAGAALLPVAGIAAVGGKYAGKALKAVAPKTLSKLDDGIAIAQKAGSELLEKTSQKISKTATKEVVEETTHKTAMELNLQFFAEKSDAAIEEIVSKISYGKSSGKLN